MLPQFRCLIVLFVGLGAMLTPPRESSAEAPIPVPSMLRPNILLIITDDQRHDSVGEFMPRTQTRLFDQGVTFTSAYTTTSSCAPSRTSILTGLYARNHGVKLNSIPFAGRSITEPLQQAGYRTGLVGKYLNRSSGRPQPGYDFWVSLPGGSGSFINPFLFVGQLGMLRQGYVTHLLRDYSLQFLDEAASGVNPFFLVFAPTAPHNPATPDEESVRLYETLPPNRPPSFNERDMRHKPAWLQQTRRLSPRRVEQIDEFRRRQLQSLQPLDQAIDQLLERLALLNQLDNTVVIYLSDNGMMWGEHRLMSKNVVYEESARTPLAIRYPGSPGAQVRSEIVANIDLAPTILDLAGVSPPWSMDGVSLVPLLRGESPRWRPGIIIEGWESRDAREPYEAFHTGRHVLVDNASGDRELYDLSVDPGQLRNLIRASPEYRTLERTLAGQFREARRSARANTLNSSGRSPRGRRFSS